MLLVDDFETAGTSGTYPILPPFVGGWFSFDDRSNQAMMLVEEKLALPHVTYNGMMSTRALHATGGPFTDYGSGFGTDLNGRAATFDLSQYKGISYWAQSATGSTITIQFSSADTDSRGMLCHKEGDPGYTTSNICDNSFSVSDAIGPNWKRYDHSFSDFKQALGWGNMPKDGRLATGKIYGILFAEPATKAFDVYVDDIVFTK